MATTHNRITRPTRLYNVRTDPATPESSSNVPTRVDRDVVHTRQIAAQAQAQAHRVSFGAACGIVRYRAQLRAAGLEPLHIVFFADDDAL